MKRAGFLAAGGFVGVLSIPGLLSSESVAPPIVFKDVTAAAGIRFRHHSGAFGKKYLPETMGSGAAFLDFDGDGWQDILFVNSMDWPGHRTSRSLPALYHNNHDGTFTDVTEAAGLGVETYGLGVAAADYDNDGRVDIYLTGLGSNHLFHNLGNGKFADVTAHAGVAASGFSTSALWFDYDKDGLLDLLVARYVDWSPERDLFCTLDGKNKSYCTPESYKGQSLVLYHNLGGGTFEDVTARAGLGNASSKALGLAMLDFDGDSWPDVAVANDTQPNKLYRNNHDGTFTEVGVGAGIAFNEAGVARAGMGIDAADYDLSGRESLVIGNFSNEMMALYHNEGRGLFIDDAPTTSIGRATVSTLTFGCFFFDYDLDGLPDIFAANGHVAEDIAAVQPKVRYAQPAHLFRNLGQRKFEDVASRVGADLSVPRVARGAAYGDFDNDGDLDLIVTTNNGPAVLLRNDGGNSNHLLRVRTVGTTSNRDGIGAVVRATLDGGRTVTGTVKTGSSYCSQSELPVTLGLGRATRIARLEILWPSGIKDSLGEVRADQAITVEEGKGIVKAEPRGPRPATAR